MIRKKTIRVLLNKTIHDAAIKKNDTRIIQSCLSYDFLASEARYHKSCHRNYTRKKENAESNERHEDMDDTTTQVNELDVFQEWFRFIRTSIIENRKVVTVVSLAEHLDQMMKDGNFTPSYFSSSSFRKTMMRRLKAEFQDVADIFLNPKGKLIFLPRVCTREKLAIDFIELQQKLDKLSSASESTKIVQDAALTLRTEVKSLQSKMSWPPQISEINPDEFEIPNYLQHFLSYLLHGSSQVSVKTSSVGQDIIYTVHQGKFLTPKHILLPFTVRSLTGNIELIKLMNRLGHSISYSKLYEVDTAYVLQKLSCSSSLIPEEISRYCQVSLVYDNIDRLEETLSGADTTHRVNGIAIQKAFIGPKALRPVINTPRTKQRTISIQPMELPIYNVGSRPEPPILPDTNAEPSKESNVIASKKNLLWILCRYLQSSNQFVSSWTGFNILVRRDINILKDSVGYLPTIDSPATAMNIVHEILCKALETKNALGLDSVVVVFDQAIYAKAVEIMWKHDTTFKSILPRLGTFHTIMVLLAIIGKRK